MPELVKMTVWGLLVLPTVTLPKLRLDGLAERTRPAPLPESETVAGEFVALLVTERLPAVVGAKVTLKLTLLPRSQGQRQGQTAGAEARSGDVRLGDGHTVWPGV